MVKQLSTILYMILFVSTCHAIDDNNTSKPVSIDQNTTKQELAEEQNTTQTQTIIDHNTTADHNTTHENNTTTINNDKLLYDKPKMFDFWHNSMSSYSHVYDMSKSEENYEAWGWIVGSSLLLFKYDEEIIDEAKKLGKKWGIDTGGQNEMKSIFSVGPFPILQTGDTKGSYLYLIGDGSIHIGIMAGMYTHGYFTDNNKSLNVASQLAEGLFGVAVVTQTIKHITGRESPIVRSEPTGKWRWFPNQKDYHEDVQKYDAFPSGHLATTMMTVTVLGENYPDNPYIKPVGWTAMGLLSFQMLNNEVHWASDYPLALAIGYAFGKVAANRQRTKAAHNWSLVPVISNDTTGANLVYRF
jgi:hypothetical protein